MNLTRDIIHIISRHSNWKEYSIDATLHDNVYVNKETTIVFLRYFLLALGMAFTMAGIIFFFAFNWAHMHKFVKLGMILALIITLSLSAAYPYS